MPIHLANISRLAERLDLNFAFTNSHEWTALQYQIVVQDGISLQGEEIAILNKHTGSNKTVYDDIFSQNR